jgi:hypothetical protein
MASMKLQMGEGLQECADHHFVELGKAKDLSKIIKCTQKAEYDFFAFKDELIRMRDHGDSFKGFSKQDYVINVSALLLKGLVRSLFVASAEEGNKEMEVVQKMMKTITHNDPDFNKPFSDRTSLSKLVYQFEEKVIHNSVFRKNYQDFVREVLYSKYQKNFTGVTNYLEGLWKKNSLMDTSAFLTKLLIMYLGVPTNLYVATEECKVPILNTYEQFGLQPKVVILLNATGYQCWATYGIPAIHGSRRRETDLDKTVDETLANLSIPPVPVMHSPIPQVNPPSQSVKTEVFSITDPSSRHNSEAIRESGILEKLVSYFAKEDSAQSKAGPTSPILNPILPLNTVNSNNDYSSGPQKEQLPSSQRETQQAASTPIAPPTLSTRITPLASTEPTGVVISPALYSARSPQQPLPSSIQLPAATRIEQLAPPHEYSPSIHASANTSSIPPFQEDLSRASLSTGGYGRMVYAREEMRNRLPRGNEERPLLPPVHGGCDGSSKSESSRTDSRNLSRQWEEQAGNVQNAGYNESSGNISMQNASNSTNGDPGFLAKLFNFAGSKPQDDVTFRESGEHQPELPRFCQSRKQLL